MLSITVARATRQLRRTAALIAFVLLLPPATIFVQEVHAVRDAASTSRSLAVFVAALGAAEKISAERGPTNGSLGSDLPISADQVMALDAARGDSDRQLSALEAAIRADRHEEEAHQAQMYLEAARTELAAARTNIDSLIAGPLASRRANDLADAIGRMVAIIPNFFTLAEVALGGIPSGESGSLTSLQSSIVAARLREEAGILGSRFTPALAAARPLTAAEQSTIDISLGRVQLLQGLINSLVVRDGYGAARAREQMNSLYFGDGLDYITSMRALATTGATGITTAEFGAAYRPLMTPILTLRDAMIKIAQDDRASYRTRALRIMWTAVAAALLMLLAVGLGTVFYERRLAQMRRLQVMAETDPLTGLDNRRAFAASWQQRRDAATRALIVFDMDHFKAVNDGHGHLVGDAALRHIAELARQTFRAEDSIARLGGEEFAVIMSGQPAQVAVAAAERFRVQVKDSPLTLPDGGRVDFTVSIGVVHTSADLDAYDALGRADRLLYRAKERRDRVEYAPA